MLFSNPLGLFWRRQWVIYLCLLLTSGTAFVYYAVSGDRYEAYTLLRAGQGIKERSGNNNSPLGEGIDLQSRMESLSRIAKIDHVILEAASAVGYDRLSSNSNPTLVARFWAWGNEIDFGDAFAKQPAGSRPRPEEQAAMEPEARAAIERNQSAILSLRDRVVAKQEGRSDLLKITFRHADPSIAASYLNELANALVAIQNTDVQMPGAQEFFQQQTKRLEEEAEIAAANLKTFSVEASIYSVDEQRQLLLKRANDLAAQIATTRGTIEERKGQKQALVDQLQVLRPVSQSRTISRIVKTLGGQEPRKAAESAAKELEQADELPPILLVKVYQDNMSSLMKVNADLTGATLLLDQLAMELENVNKDLASLSAKEAEYGRLKRALTTSSAAAAHYANRILEEEISSEVAKKSQLSSLRVVQRAITPTAPVFPQIPQLIGLALIGGILLGFALIIGPELARGAMMAGSQEKRALGVGDDDLVDLLVARRRREGSKDLHSA